MKINSNSTAVLTGNYLTRAENALSRSTKKLSSGYKINNASDNPSGYALSSKMRAQIRSLEKACDNTDMATDFIKTGDGAMQEVHSILQRMNELAVKSANGTNTEEDRKAIDEEVQELCKEIDRIGAQTNFNDSPILNGNYEYRGYLTNDRSDVSILGYSEETKSGEFSLSLDISATLKPGTTDEYEYKYNGVTDTSSPVKLADSLVGEINGSILTLTGEDGTRLDLALEGAAPGGAINFKLEKIGAMRIQVGDHEGEIMEMSIPEVSTRKMGIDALNLTTEEGAKEAISKIGYAIDYASRVRSTFGAYQNRLEHASASLDVTVESLNSSYSTLVDTDMAEEMTEFTRLQVLQQAATSMLAQANEFPQQALQLLQ